MESRRFPVQDRGVSGGVAIASCWVQMRSLVLSSLVLCAAGCQTFVDAEANGNGTQVGDPTQPVRRAFVGASLIPTLDARYGLNPIAAGGSSTLSIRYNDVSGLDVITDGGPATLTLDNDSGGDRAFLVTTTPTPGTTTITILTNEIEPSDWALETKPVTSVEVLPDVTYRRASASTLAFTESARTFRFALNGPDAAKWTDLLVDGTLAIDNIALTALAWDHFQLPAGAATHHVTATAASFGSRTFDIEVVDAIDRIESLVEGTPVVNGSMTVCFFAYRGTREVYVPYAITPPGGVAYQSLRNCTRVLPATRGHYEVTASALGLSQTASFDVP